MKSVTMEIDPARLGDYQSKFECKIIGVSPSFKGLPIEVMYPDDYVVEKIREDVGAKVINLLSHKTERRA